MKNFFLLILLLIIIIPISASAEWYYNPFTSKLDYYISGNVTSSGNMTDNKVLRGDGGLGIQDSNVTITDDNNVTTPGKITAAKGFASGANPLPHVDYEDSNATIPDRIHGMDYGDLTDTGNGTEDFDRFWQAMFNGTLFTFMDWDASEKELSINGIIKTEFNPLDGNGVGNRDYNDNRYVTRSYGISWNESADTYTRTGVLAGVACGSSPGNAALPIQAAMRRCILSDAGEVVYFLKSDDSYNRSDLAPYISGTDDAGTANKVSDAVLATGTDDVGTSSKVSDVGVFTAAASEYVGKWVHNTTDDTYAVITAKDSNDVLSINVDIMDITETFNIGILSAPVAEYVGHYVHDTTDDVYAMITAKDSDAALSIATDILSNGDTFEICTAVLNGDDGQVMVQIPAFYYGYAYLGTTHTWTVSFVPEAGLSLHHAFHKNGEDVDYRYMSAYEGVLYDTSESKCVNGLYLPSNASYKMSFNGTTEIITSDTLTHPFTNLEVGVDKIVISGTVNNNLTVGITAVTDTTITTDGNLTDEANVACIIQVQRDWTASTGDVLGSISGKVSMNYGTRANFRAVADNRGTGWRQQSFDLVSAIQLLYLIEYGSWYSQSEIGNGLTDWSSANWPAWNNNNPIEKTGLSNGLGNATGSVSNGSNTKGSYMSYRGIENFYGHVWEWVDGFNVNSNVPYVCNVDTNFADDTATNYTALGVTLANANGYQKTLEQIARGFLPASIGGSSSTYITDYYYLNTGWRVATLGGSAASGTDAGVACWRLFFSSASANQGIGSRSSW